MQSVNLTCSTTGTDVVYQWMRNGVIISDDNSNVLRINEIKQSDDGIYQCIASNKGGNVTSNPAMIKVYGKKFLITMQTFCTYHYRQTCGYSTTTSNTWSVG